MRRRLAGLRSATIVVAVSVLLAGISPAGSLTPAAAHTGGGGPRLELSARRVMVDQRFGITVRGLEPGVLVQLDLVLERADASTWASRAVFRADRRGRVDVATMAPVEGDYQGTDAMGLIWSARRQPQPPASELEDWTDLVRVRASVGGQEIGAADVVRYYLRPGSRATPVRERGLVGTLFEPGGPHRPRPAHGSRGGRRPTVIVVGGSEGGLASAETRAALLASHGMNALALAYFDPTGALASDLPTQLSLIPLEYFSTAIDWLQDQPAVEDERIGILGASKGGELALLLASRHPELRAVVAYVPSSVVWAGLGAAEDPSGYFTSSWSEGGEPVPFLGYDFGGVPDFYTGALDDQAAVARAAIPVERANGPVLLVSGTDDRLWPSTRMADQVLARLEGHGHPFPDRHLAYEGAGHGITFPYQPTPDVAAGGLPLGGTPAATARAARDHWPRVLRFLHRTL